jgi:hypothetical protein
MALFQRLATQVEELVDPVGRRFVPEEVHL